MRKIRVTTNAILLVFTDRNERNKARNRTIYHIFVEEYHVVYA